MPRSLTLAILLVLVFCGPVQAESSAPRVPPGFQLYPAAKPVGEVRFLDAQDHVVRLADFKGRLVLINLWATWCPSCQLEMPTLDSLQEKLGPEGLRVIAISLDKQGLPMAAPFFRDNGIKNLPLYLDPQWAVRKSLNAEGLPATILISRDGWELGRAAGWQNWTAPAMLVFLRDMLQAH